MSNESFDKKVREALLRGTYEPTDEMLEKNRKIIMERIEKMEETNMTRKANRWKKAVGISAAAVVTTLALGGIFTQPGQAALEKIRQYFEPEKVVEYEIEGDKEDIDSRLQQSEMGYVIYYDQERYKIVEDGEIDRIVMKEEYPDIPEVYMEISQEVDTSPEELADKLAADLKGDFSKVDGPKKVDEPLKAVHIHAIDGGTQPTDPIVNYYLVDNTKGGTFVIKMKYFLEAAEGHGARFHQMLKNFAVVDLEN